MDPFGHPEPHGAGTTSKLNWLRAGVLGANDGIVSISGLVVGVAGATNSTAVILTAGLAGIIAGAISMAAGEYVSVSSSRDTERALIEKERKELKLYPKEELAELEGLYEKIGLSKKTALQVARELTAKDALRAHLDIELGINPDDLTNPWHAAIASAASFFLGSLIPLITIIFPPATIRVPVTFISVLLALAITGILSARIGGASTLRAAFRVVSGGALAMAVTYAIGSLFHVSGI